MAHSVMDIHVGNEHDSPSSNLGRGSLLSYSASTLGKGISTLYFIYIYIYIYIYSVCLLKC